MSSLRLSRALVCHAAHKAPPDLQERLKEEWLADLTERLRAEAAE